MSVAAVNTADGFTRASALVEVQRGLQVAQGGVRGDGVTQ